MLFLDIQANDLSDYMVVRSHIDDHASELHAAIQAFSY